VLLHLAVMLFLIERSKAKAHKKLKPFKRIFICGQHRFVPIRPRTHVSLTHACFRSHPPFHPTDDNSGGIVIALATLGGLLTCIMLIAFPICFGRKKKTVNRKKPPVNSSSNNNSEDRSLSCGSSLKYHEKTAASTAAASATTGERKMQMLKRRTEESSTSTRMSFLDEEISTSSKDSYKTSNTVQSMVAW